MISSPHQIQKIVDCSGICGTILRILKRPKAKQKEVNEVLSQKRTQTFVIRYLLHFEGLIIRRSIYPIYSLCRILSVKLGTLHLRQCDQIWRNFSTLANVKNSCQLFEALISIWKIFEPTLENSVCFWANLYCCKWPNIE